MRVSHQNHAFYYHLRILGKVRGSDRATVDCRWAVGGSGDRTWVAARRIRLPLSSRAVRWMVGVLLISRWAAGEYANSDFVCCVRTPTMVRMMLRASAPSAVF